MECLSTAVPVSHGPGAKFIARAQMTLFAIQCHLDSQGASKLIVDLVVNSFTNNKIFSEVSSMYILWYVLAELSLERNIDI